MNKRKISVILLSAIMAFTMMFAGTSSVFAADSTTIPTLPDDLTNAPVLESGSGFNAANPNTSVYRVYKLIAPSKGYYTIRFEGTSSNNYQTFVFNASKKCLYTNYEYTSSTDQFTTHFGVNAGTYYFAVRTYESTYVINTDFTATTSKTSSKRSGAILLKRGVTKTGTLALNGPSSSWYKIRLTSSRKVKIDAKAMVGGAGNYGDIQVDIYRISDATSSPSLITSLSSYSPSKTLNPYTIGNNNKLAAGTYYIRVTKYHNGNGGYSLKWSYR